MSIFPTNAHRLILLFCTIFITFSCSKDSDLLADYVNPGNLDGQIRLFVVDDTFRTAVNASIRMNVLSNDNFPEEKKVRIKSTSNPRSGNVSINEDNTLTYEPTGPADTTDSFDYTAEVVNEDASVSEETGTVTVTISEMGELKAFPGAEGFGKNATGGRGGKVIEVTNLNDSGTGSLRSAINATGPRTVIFKVSGYITLQSSLNISDGNITIAGQTSPGDGITIRISGNTDISALKINTSNIIIRGIRFRPGKTSDMGVNGDAVTLLSGNDIIFDHCSFSWSTDELINPYGASDITFQNCIFSEGLMYSSHSYSTDSTHPNYYNPHSMGMLMGNQSNQITIYNSIFAHNNQRNPLIGGSKDPGLNFELVNNIYYNWGAFGTVISSDSQIKVNMINNYYISGPNTMVNRYSILMNDNVNLFARGNINDFRLDNQNSERLAIGTLSAPFELPVSESKLIGNAFDFPLAQTALIEPNTLLEKVTGSAGAFVQDLIDERIINDIFSRTGNLINDPSEVGGYPNLNGGIAYTDNDHDGMEDEWEIANGLDPQDPNDGQGDINDDGYTNLEQFLVALIQ